MKSVARSLIVVLVAMISVPALVVSVTITTAVQLLATTALIMGGTQHPLSNPPDTNEFIAEYLGLANDHYITPANGGVPAGGSVAVVYPAEFFPVFGSTTFGDSVAAGRANLNNCIRGLPCNGEDGPVIPRSPGDGAPGTTFIVFGYSQSAVVASLVKGDLIADPTGAPADTQFDLVSNPTRPNGGILGRGFEGFTIPILGIPFYGPTPNSCPSADPCTPEDTGKPVYYTTDVAQQYDFLGGDAPARLDPIAFANSIAAYALLHGNMPNRTIDGSDPQVVSQGTYGDTNYYMVTAPRLPLLMIVEQAGVPGPLLALPDALLRVWIEDKYRRDLSPGEHVTFQLIPVGNPVALVGNMLGAVPVGIDDTVAQATGDPENRPLGTANVYRPFGVGGPVYDANGDRTTDNVGIPTGAGDNDTPDSLQTLGEPQTTETDLETKNEQKSEQLGNVTEQPETPADATKPKRPLQIIRDSLNFDPSKNLPAARPSGDGPLKRIVNALTGQKPDSSTENKPAADANAGDAAA